MQRARDGDRASGDSGTKKNWQHLSVYYGECSNGKEAGQYYSPSITYHIIVHDEHLLIILGPTNTPGTTS